MQLRDISEPIGDDADVASKVSIAEVEHGISLNRLRLSAVNAWRAKDGSFLCKDCLLSIPISRMQAIPSAIRCLDCQQESDFVNWRSNKCGDKKRTRPWM